MHTQTRLNARYSTEKKLRNSLDFNVRLVEGLQFPLWRKCGLYFHRRYPGHCLHDVRSFFFCPEHTPFDTVTYARSRDGC